jgi:hypothetical protein
VHRTPFVLPLRGAGCPPTDPSPGGLLSESAPENLPPVSASPATEKNAYIAFENETGEVAKMAVLRPSQPPLDAPHDPIAQTAMSLGLVSRHNEPTVTRMVDSTPTPANTKRALTPPRSVLPPITPPPPPPPSSSLASNDDPPSDEDFEVKTLARRLFGDPRPEPADTGETASYKSEEETLARPVSSSAAAPTGSVLNDEEENEKEKDTLTAKHDAAHLDEEIDTLSRGSSPPPSRDALPPPPPSSKGGTAILDTTATGGKKLRESIAELAATTTPFPYPPLDPSPGPGAAIRTPMVMITSPEDNATRIQPMVGYPPPHPHHHPAVNAASLNQPTSQPGSAHQSYPPHSVPVRTNSPIPFPELFRQATSNVAPIQKVAMFIIGTLIVAIISFLVIRPANPNHATQPAAAAAANNKPATPVLMAPIDPPVGAAAVVVPPVATTPPPPPTTTSAPTTTAPAPTPSTKPADPPAKRRVVTRPVPRANIPVRREQ